MTPLIPYLAIASGAAAIIQPSWAPVAAPLAFGMLAYSTPPWLQPAAPDGCMFDYENNKRACDRAVYRNTAIAVGAGLLLGLAMREMSA